MSYQTALTILDVIKDIDAKKYVLPSIQREFVWSPAQIEMLFDSLMREYPINTFLFWQVPRDKIHEFKFYEFLQDYHELNNYHNPKANLNGCGDIVAILDGQQRMTSLYIALKGTYAYKMPHKRWDNLAAYPVRKLYLNLLDQSEEPDMLYDFKFLTAKEASERDGNHYWYPVGEILNIHKLHEVNTYLTKNGLAFVHTKDDEAKVIFANETLAQLFSVIHEQQTISYYLEKSTELDKVLHIFTRVNSGGTILSHSDLLLSFATAQWSTRDAREEINRFMDEINQIGQGFDIGKDTILKSCLVLSDVSDISFKVDNFNRTNMLDIERDWDSITAAMRLAVELVASFGFSRDNITSDNLFIPIAYYLKSIGIPSNFVDSKKYENDREALKKWFVAALLKRIFSFTPNSALKPIRSIIQTNPGRFPLEKIVTHFKNTNRDISFTDENIEDLLFTKYGRDALLLLSLISPWADLRNNFHIDHIYPKSLFTKSQLQKRGYTPEKIEFYMENVNYIGNLQLLDGQTNKEKSNEEFALWLDQKYPTTSARAHFMEQHYIPTEGSIAFDDFEEFLSNREALLRLALRNELL